MKRKKKKVRILEKSVLRIVGDGLIAGPDFHGKATPILVLDTSEHPEVERVITASREEPDGDALSTWAMSDGNPMLSINFLRPVSTTVVIAFRMPDQGILVEAILSARRVLLKAGSSTDTFKSTFDRPAIAVEIPETGFDQAWSKIYDKALMSKLRGAGFGLGQARKDASDVKETLRHIVDFRMPR